MERYSKARKNGTHDEGKKEKSMGKNIRKKTEQSPKPFEIKLRKVIYDPCGDLGFYCYVTPEDLSNKLEDLHDLFLEQFTAWTLSNEVRPYHKLEWTEKEEDFSTREKAIRRFYHDKHRIEYLEEEIAQLKRDMEWATKKK